MENKLNLQIGDKVIVARDMAILSHPDTKTEHRAVVVGMYPNFFNVEYKEGFQQSIMYQDMKYIVVKSRKAS